MLTGLEILIARMKDHPDEFLLTRKWDTLIEDFGECFTEEERSALKAARSEVMRDLFNEAVLKRLAGEEESEPPPSTAKIRMQGRYAFGATDPRTMLGQSPLINSPMIAAKQANAARQQEAYNTATQQRIYSEQRGLQNSIDFKPFV